MLCRRPHSCPAPGRNLAVADRNKGTTRPCAQQIARRQDGANKEPEVQQVGVPALVDGDAEDVYARHWQAAMSAGQVTATADQPFSHDGDRKCSDGEIQAMHSPADAPNGQPEQTSDQRRKGQRQDPRHTIARQ